MLDVFLETVMPKASRPVQLLALPLLLALSLTALGTADALAQAARKPDARIGETIAARWCNSCHVATSSQRVGGDAVPTFARIARGQNLSADSIRAALDGRHPRMPDLQLSRPEIEDLAAYILTLKP
jgi:mono/diheme cytochrome c family protein